MTSQLSSELISAPLANQILERFQTRQPEIESFMRALVEAESPSGDEDGSRAVVDLLADAARSVTCVDAVERVAELDACPFVEEPIGDDAVDLRADLGDARRDDAAG